MLTRSDPLTIGKGIIVSADGLSPFDVHLTGTANDELRIRVKEIGRQIESRQQAIKAAKSAIREDKAAIVELLRLQSEFQWILMQDMFDSADEFIAEYRVSEAADRIAV